ncbi:MAG: hypothetical protein WA919_19615 [Coleofasciculaceae cyanobacterium]
MKLLFDDPNPPTFDDPVSTLVLDPVDETSVEIGDFYEFDTELVEFMDFTDFTAISPLKETTGFSTLDTPVSLDGNFALNATFTDAAQTFVLPELESTLGLEEGAIPSSISFANDFQTDVVLTEDAQFDGNRVIVDADFVGGVLGVSGDDSLGTVLGNFGVNIPPNIQTTLDTVGAGTVGGALNTIGDLFNIEFNGSGTVTKDTGESSTFDFEFVEGETFDQSQLIINNFSDTAVASSFLDGPSTVSFSDPDILVRLQTDNLVELLEDNQTALGLTSADIERIQGTVDLGRQFFVVNPFTNEMDLLTGSLDVTTQVIPG